MKKFRVRPFLMGRKDQMHCFIIEERKQWWIFNRWLPYEVGHDRFYIYSNFTDAHRECEALNAQAINQESSNT